MQDFIFEEGREVPVFDTADILIVGAGAAGHSAAVAAARAGASNIVLLERYGYMGGLVTGGYVLQIPALTWRTESYVRGLQEEWISRLEKYPGGILGPTFAEAGCVDKKLTERWRFHNGMMSNSKYAPTHAVRAINVEPQLLKIEMDNMILEQKDKIRLYLHSWGTRPIMDGNTITGVIFESKQGRMAIKAKIVIDATGDGDIYSQAGAPYFDNRESKTRVAKTALVYRVGGCDFEKFREWRLENQEKYQTLLMEPITRGVGFRTFPLPSSRNDIIWFNNYIEDKNCIDVNDLTYTEIVVRQSIMTVIEHYKRNVPGYENAFLYDIAPQTGTRCSRRLNGEYVMTFADFATKNEFDDVIAWHSTICRVNDGAPIEIPYRAILPQKIDNLICPGRHLSADEVAIDCLLLIPQCVGTGQAAGVAAAVAVMDGTTARNVDIKKVQEILIDQDVPLPRNARTDPKKVKNLVDNDYGTYTDEAKKILAGLAAK